MSADVATSIMADLYHYEGQRGLRAFLLSYLRLPGFRYTVHLRIASAWRRSRHPLRRIASLMSHLILRQMGHVYGYQIPAGTEIGPGLYIGHHGTIVVNRCAIVGANVNVAPGVVIGQTNRGQYKGTPIIGDRVWIGVNAVIVGGIKVGSDALIGPGAYVNKDVPERAVVIGNPARIVSYEGSGGYVNWVAKGIRPGLERL